MSCLGRCTGHGQHSSGGLKSLPKTAARRRPRPGHFKRRGRGVIGGQGSEIWLLLLPVTGHAFSRGCDLWFGGGVPADLPAYPRSRIGLEGW